MSAAYDAALDVLRHVHSRLAVRDLPIEERFRLLEMNAAALRVLEQSRGERRLKSIALARRVAELENRLADWQPRERALEIQRRLGIRRSRYFELRGLARQSGCCRTESRSGRLAP